MRYGLNILVQGFCPLIIKITQFPDGFRSNACVVISSSFQCDFWSEAFFAFFWLASGGK